jgi:ATP-binding cassette subfamily C (CFTR/MRP) protein 1
MAALYYVAATYYRRSSVETKRLDSLMRSALYGSYSGNTNCPSPSDLFIARFRNIDRSINNPSVWGAGEHDSHTPTLTLNVLQANSVKNADEGLDMENRAYYMTISIQRWLAIRLDIFGNVLTFGIALFAAGYRRTVDPSKIGVVLTYALSSKCGLITIRGSLK